MIFTWARFFAALLVGGILLTPLDLMYVGLKNSFVAIDPITYSGTYFDFVDAFIVWLPFMLLIGGLLGLYIDSRRRESTGVFMG